ncbi:hypothetical protein COB11_01380 [Candidatus Aerophobetes bacterium]|uniref:Uncharacterized protein n=1 Tax=Aerophobetes bacterium TaxID=2030807 RepID=A0A2A4YN33_UNCAE|nr:MAG: hypothetical protein COB11_01380 [Candidatus Aerophobetes bacterium]
MSTEINLDDTRIISAFINNDFQTAEINSARLELELDEYSYYPFVSTCTSFVRGIHAITQITAGIAKGIFSVITDLFAKHRYGLGVVRGFSFALHGYLNLVRATYEYAPISGNIWMLIHDTALPRMKYSVEYQFNITAGNQIRKSFENIQSVIHPKLGR